MNPAFYDLLASIDHLMRAKAKLDRIGESELVEELKGFIHKLDLFITSLSEVDF